MPSIGSRLLGTAALLVALMGPAPSAAAGTPFTVTKTTDTKDGTCDADCSLREAIDAANAAPDASTIVLPAGTYTLTIPGTGESANVDGDLDVTAPVTIVGSGAGSTIINGNGAVTSERVLQGVGGASDVTISGATIMGGDEASSGGAFTMGGDLTLTDAVVGPNHTDSSGGAVDSGSPTSLTDVTFIGNTAGDSGGAFSTGSPITGTNVLFVGNGADGSGGAFSTGGAVTLTNAWFVGNEADGSGGAFSSGAPITLTNVLFEGNTAGDSGGAASTGAAFTVTVGIFSGNSSGSSGGALSNGGVTTLTNVTMSGNRAVAYGGAMSHGGTTTINNATITGNTADSDGDSDGDGGAWSGGSLTLSNSIVAGNVDGSPGAEDPDCDGAITSNGHNILGIDAGCTFTPDVGDKVGTTGAPIDPMIGPLADNGGAYQTHALLSGSPAIDAGSTLRSAEADTACTATDSRGVPRGLGGRCDMGSYELVRCMGTVVNRVGTSGDDRLVGTGGADGFLAFEGDDRLLGRGGPDRMCAGPGKDRLKGGGGNDRLRGQGGRDVLIGGGGNDRLIGGPGPDVCKGGGGKKDRARSCKVRRGIP